jgi:hypothetical protein
VAPAGAKAVPKGGVRTQGGPSQAPPRGGGIGSNRDALGANSRGEVGKWSGAAKAALNGAMGGVEVSRRIGPGGAVEGQTDAAAGSSAAQSGHSAQAEIKFPAYEALRFPISFRQALARFHSRRAEKSRQSGHLAESTEVSASGGDLLKNQYKHASTSRLSRASHGIGTKPGDASIAAVRQSRSARLGFLSRLRDEVRREPAQSTPSEPREAFPIDALTADFSSHSVESEAHRHASSLDPVFALLRVQSDLLESCEGCQLWRGVAPGKGCHGQPVCIPSCFRSLSFRSRSSKIYTDPMFLMFSLYAHWIEHLTRQIRKPGPDSEGLFHEIES